MADKRRENSGRYGSQRGKSGSFVSSNTSKSSTRCKSEIGSNKLNTNRNRTNCNRTNRAHISENALEITTKRSSVVLLLFALVAIVIMVMVFLLSVVDVHGVSETSVDRRTRTDTVFAKRGTIYDRNGNIIAMSVECVTIVANPNDISDPEATAEVLAEVLDGSVSDYIDAVSKEDSYYVYVKRQADVDEGNKLEELKTQYNEAAEEQYEEELEKARLQAERDGEEFDSDSFMIDPDNEYHDYRYYLNPLFGISFEDGMKRVYPYGQAGGQIIGYVGIDGEGLSGIEKQYNDILAGTNGTKTAQYGIGGIEIPGTETVNEEAIDGMDITISIDITLQEYAEEQLVLQANAGSANTANIVVIDGATGEIYACASTPLYDLSNASEAEPDASTLKAISDAYEPGSIFKSVSASVMLEEGVVSPTESISVADEIELYDRTIRDAATHSTQKWTLTNILENSSNVGMTILEQRLESETFYGYLVKFGFGQKTGVDYPGEAEGLLSSANKWDPVTEANISFGQGVSTSTIQMASFYGSLANDGVKVSPHFLMDYTHSDQSVTYDSQRILTSQTVSTLTDMLVSVVKNGTGKPAKVSGYDIAGKTGTGQKLTGKGEYSEYEDWIDFAGYFANTNSQVACVVAMDDPDGSYAMPVFKSVMQYIAERYVVVDYD